MSAESRQCGLPAQPPEGPGVAPRAAAQTGQLHTGSREAATLILNGKGGTRSWVWENQRLNEA